MSDIDALADTVGKGLVDYFIHEESIDALDSLVAIAKNAEGALALADEMKVSKFAPAREDGMKPWVRMSYHFGRETSQIVYAKSALDAKHMYGRMHLETVRVRRATPEDLAKKELEQSLVATRNALIGTQRVRDDYKARAERAERERAELIRNGLTDETSGGGTTSPLRAATETGTADVREELDAPLYDLLWHCTMADKAAMDANLLRVERERDELIRNGLTDLTNTARQLEQAERERDEAEARVAALQEALALADEIIAPISAASEEVANKILAFRAALAPPVQGDTE